MSPPLLKFSNRFIFICWLPYPQNYITGNTPYSTGNATHGRGWLNALRMNSYNLSFQTVSLWGLLWFILGRIGHIPHARGGVFSYVVTIFFNLPMPARKCLISWHITIFAVHGFCGDLVFFVRIPWCVVLIFYFSPLRKKFFNTSRNFLFF